MIKAILTASVIVLVGSTAQAAVVDVTITGFVSDQSGGFYDDLNIFSGGLLGGAAFTARFVYDTALGERNTSLDTSFDPVKSVDSLYIGSELEDVPYFASLTIGSVTREIKSLTGYSDILNQSSAYLEKNVAPGAGLNYDLALYEKNSNAFNDNYKQSASENLSFFLYGVLGSLPTSLETSYVISELFNDGGFTFPFLGGKWAYTEQDMETGTYRYSLANLSSDQLTVSVRGGDTGGGGSGGGGGGGVDPMPSPVPLPASLPLLLAGLAALVGWQSRSRRIAA